MYPVSYLISPFASISARFHFKFLEIYLQATAGFFGFPTPRPHPPRPPAALPASCHREACLGPIPRPGRQRARCRARGRSHLVRRPFGGVPAGPRRSSGPAARRGSPGRRFPLRAGRPRPVGKTFIGNTRRGFGRAGAPPEAQAIPVRPQGRTKARGAAWD